MILQLITDWINIGYHYRTDILANSEYKFDFGAALHNLHVIQCITQ